MPSEPPAGGESVAGVASSTPRHGWRAVALTVAAVAATTLAVVALGAAASSALGAGRADALTRSTPPVPAAPLEKGNVCARCMHARCAKGACGHFYREPVGWQRPYCMCGCCKLQCGQRKGCKAVAPRKRGYPINVSTVAGNGALGTADSPSGLSAGFGKLTGLALSPDRLHAVLTEEGSAAIRVVDLRSTAVSTAARGVGRRPHGVAFRPDQPSTVLFTDMDANTLKQLHLPSGNVSVVAGSGEWDLTDGEPDEAAFAAPSGVAVSSDGSFAAVADTDNNAIRLVELPSGRVRTLAGTYTERPAETLVDGAGAAARFSQPMGVAISDDDRTVYVADTGFHVIRAVDVATGATRTFAGSGVAGDDDTDVRRHNPGQFHAPRGVSLGPGGRALIVADTANNVVRRVEVALCHAGVRCKVQTLAGGGEPAYQDGVAPAAMFNSPTAVASELNHDDRPFALIADEGNAMVRAIYFVDKALSWY